MTKEKNHKDQDQEPSNVDFVDDIYNNSTKDDVAPKDSQDQNQELTFNEIKELINQLPYSDETKRIMLEKYKKNPNYMEEEVRINKNKELPREKNSKDNPFTIPDGKFGDLVWHSFRRLPKPSLPAGIVFSFYTISLFFGNKYNIGLNVLLSLIGSSGVGKSSVFDLQTKFIKQICQLLVEIAFTNLKNNEEESKKSPEIKKNDDFNIVIYTIITALRELNSIKRATGSSSLHASLSSHITRVINIGFEEAQSHFKALKERLHNKEKEKRDFILEGYSLSEPDQDTSGVNYTDKSKNYGTVSSPSVSVFYEGIKDLILQYTDDSDVGGGYIGRNIIFDVSTIDNIATNLDCIYDPFPNEILFMFLNFFVYTNVKPIVSSIKKTIDLAKEDQSIHEKIYEDLKLLHQENKLSFSNGELKDLRKEFPLRINCNSVPISSDVFNGKIIPVSDTYTNNEDVNDGKTIYYIRDLSNKYQVFLNVEDFYFERIDIEFTKEAKFLKGELLANYEYVKTSSKEGNTSNLHQRYLRNTLKLACLLGAMDNPYKPNIIADYIHYANNIITNCINNIDNLDKKGEIGGLTKEQDLKKAFFIFFRSNLKSLFNDLNNSKNNKQASKYMTKNLILNINSINQKLKNNKAFINHSYSSSEKIRTFISDNIEEDYMVVVNLENFNEKRSIYKDELTYLEDCRYFHKLGKECGVPHPSKKTTFVLFRNDMVKKLDKENSKYFYALKK